MSTAGVIFNVLGMLGAALLLFGFYRINSGRWSNKYFWYEFDNLLGALLVVTYQVYYHAYVTVLVNIVWAVVALWGLIIFIKRFHAHRRNSKRAH